MSNFRRDEWPHSAHLAHAGIAEHAIIDDFYQLDYTNPFFDIPRELLSGDESEQHHGYRTRETIGIPWDAAVQMEEGYNPGVSLIDIHLDIPFYYQGTPMGMPISNQHQDTAVSPMEISPEAQNLSMTNGSGPSIPSTQLPQPTVQPLTDSQKYECRICPKSFDRPSRMENCRNRHSGAKPHKCRGRCGTSGCTAKYSSAEYLRRHINPSNSCPSWIFAIKTQAQLASLTNGSVADYEQVLHLQQIDIESSIAPNIRLELQIDKTPVNIRNGDNACWRANHAVEVTSTSDISLAVMTGHRPFRKEKVIRITGSDVWNSPSESKFSISRSITLNKQLVKATFEFCVPATPGSDAAFAALQRVWDDAKGYRSLIGSSKLQQSFDTALKIGVALSELDPFTKAAFALARTTFELLKEQQRYDDLILKLADSFKRILPFATIVALDSEMSTTLQVIVEDLFDIVEKGAEFICQYVRRTSINRLLVSLFSSEDREFIDRLQERLARITDDFDRAAAVDTLQAVHDARDRSLLKEVLKPIDEATYNLDRGCFEGTRQDILPKIFNWTSDSSSPTKILWLYGIPGSGKTSVATSLCDMLHAKKSLAASFFCRRDDPILSKPESLFPTLIYHLASAWRPYRKLVANTLRADSMLQPKLTKRLFDELIVKPLQTLDQHPTCTLVIVIDALDEYGDIDSRRDLLSNILTATSAVDWLKVVVTSRHDHDIEGAFTKLGSDAYFSLDLDVAHDTQTDIRLFAEKKLTSLGERRHIPDWPSEELLDVVMEHSGGLFISVQTMWLLIKESRRPDQLLNQVLEGKAAEGAHDHLYELYKSILNIKVGLEPQDVDDFRYVIGSIIVVADRRSLRDETLAALLEMEPHVVKSMVDDVESLFYQEGEGKAVRVRHLSIIDFLSGSGCPQQYRVDFQQVNAKLTKGCFKIMSKELRFNICELQTSFLLNDKVTDMDDRISRWISDRLLYSCIQWSSHLESTSDSLRAERASIEQAVDTCQLREPSPAKLLEKERGNPVQANRQIKSFQERWMKEEKVSVNLTAELERLRIVEEKEKSFHDEIFGYIQHFTLSQFLFWLEVLSVIKKVGLASRMLSALLHWVQSNNQDDAMARDMLEFVASFAAVISQNAPHIYLSALPFAPQNSAVSRRYTKLYPRTLLVRTGGHTEWPPIQLVMFGHTGSVTSVAFSHDGRHIVSGSNDKTICVWDAETGEMVGKPFEGHIDQVTSVAFSHDSKYIVSGSWDKTVRVWDAESGNVVGEPFEGHTISVTSVAFSHDSKYVISGSDDQTIRIWDAESGKAVGEHFKGHAGSVISVAFSPDSKRIASGSADQTIRVWDTESRKAIGEPFKGHADRVISVAFSRDGRHIVSGSADQTIRVWDAESGKAVGEPFKGHTNRVISVAFSHDGRHIVSGSYDWTIRVWDAESGKAVGEPFKGHTDLVTSVAFSHDGKYIASGSYDRTIHVWDAESRKAVGEPFKGHANQVTSVAFSHDSKYIVSGSWDKTVRVWDSESGNAVGEPFEGHTDLVTSVAFSHDSKYVISGSDDQTIRVWNAESGKAVGEPFKGHTDAVISVVFSPDSKRIASGSVDQTIRVWDAESRKAVGEPFKGHADRVLSVAFSRDGRHIVSGSADQTIRVWDAESGKAVGEPFKGHADGVVSVAFSPDGREVVSSSDDNTVRVWDAETGKAVGEPFGGHTGPVASVAFSPDGKRIVSGSDDDTVRVWDAEAGKAVGEPFEGHTNSVRSVAFSHDGKRVVSGSVDNTVRVWDVEGEPINSPHFVHYSKIVDGWAVNSNSQVLFWAPPAIRPGLLTTDVKLIIGNFIKTTLDLTAFTYGESWTLCRDNNHVEQLLPLETAGG